MEEREQARDWRWPQIHIFRSVQKALPRSWLLWIYSFLTIIFLKVVHVWKLSLYDKSKPYVVTEGKLLGTQEDYCFSHLGWFSVKWLFLTWIFAKTNGSPSLVLLASDQSPSQQLDLEKAILIIFFFPPFKTIWSLLNPFAWSPSVFTPLDPHDLVHDVHSKPQLSLLETPHFNLPLQ